MSAPDLLRPWLAIIALSAAAYLAGDYRAASQYKEKEAAATGAAKVVLERANDDAKEIEKSLKQKMATLVDQNQKDLHDETVKRSRFIADVRSGAVRLSIPVVACRANAASADPAAAGGDRHETRAELAPEAGAALAAIADDGDDAIRQLNSCIDAYEIARNSHVQAR